MNSLLSVVIIAIFGLSALTNNIDVDATSDYDNVNYNLALSIAEVDDVNIHTDVQCNCARLNSSIFRRVGMGNKKCLASNVGSGCLSGWNVNCQSANSNCGGDNEEGMD